MELRNYPNLNIYLYNYQTETAIFLATKHEKTIMACSCYLNFQKIFRSFRTFGQQYYKNGSIHLNSWKHRPYLLIFCLNLKYLGQQYRKCTKTAKNGGFSEELFSENSFEAVLANFCCYDYSANASKAVQKISTRTLELCQLTKTANFIATSMKKHIQQFITGLLEIQARFLFFS